MISIFIEKLKQRLSFNFLIKLILILTVIVLFQVLWPTFREIIKLALVIMSPFFTAFLIAFVLDPFASYLSSKFTISRKLAMTLVWLIILALFCLLMFSLIPLLINRFSFFLNSLDYGIRWVQSNFLNDDLKILEQINIIAKNNLNAISNYVLNFSQNIPSLISRLSNTFTQIIFVLTLSIYMSFDFDNIKQKIAKLFHKYDKHQYFDSVASNISIYINSILILMLIKFIEYSIFFMLFKHNDWLIIGMLISLGMLIPYVGALIGQIVGILTAFSYFSIEKTMLLILALALLSMFDGYFIDPNVHKKRSNISIIVTLAAVFAGSVVAGIFGMIFALPCIIFVKTIYHNIGRSIENEKV